MVLYDEYSKKDLKQKISFWDEKIEFNITSYEEKDVFNFLKSVVMEKSEKVFCKRRALQEMFGLTLSDKLKDRKTIAFLLDEWASNQDTSLECLRIRYLSLFYQKEKKEIEDILLEKSNDSNCDIKSEASYQLGLIKLFEANEAFDERKYINSISLAGEMFSNASENEENRDDAEVLLHICRYIKYIFLLKQHEANQEYKSIMTIIWKTQLLYFDDSYNPVYIGISRCISRIQRLIKTTPEYWLDYRKEFNNLCLQFYELKNSHYKDKSLYSNIIEKMGDALVKKVVEPVFKFNFKATISKIDAILCEENIKDNEKEFLTYLKNVIESENLKMIDSEEELLKEIYPMLTDSDFQNFNKKIFELNVSGAVYTILKATNRYSYDKLLNSLITACVKLQGNYHYKNSTEDERNDHIRDLLQMGGYLIKDQTRWGESNAGRAAGEVDILVEENNRPYSIIEALNLNALDSSYLNLHINKIYKYDTTGLQNNFIVSYVRIKDFETFWKKYKEHIQKHEYPYRICSFNDKIDEEFDYAGIKVALTKHNRDGKIVGLYHVCVKISE